MYTPGGQGLSEVGDIEIFPHGDELHLFHLTLPNHDVVQHAVSQDGLSWKRLPNAIRTGDPGDVDDDQIWTMSVSDHNGEYVMLYTALSQDEDGMVQRNAIATSPDLIHWTKRSNRAVTEADSRWYESERVAGNGVSWRDPKPIKVDDTWYVAVCARVKQGDIMRRGSAGLYTTTDFQTFEIHPPLIAPDTYWDLECPQIFTVDGTFYLTAGIMEDMSQRYWMAPSIDGPWTVPPDGGRLVPDGHYAGRVGHWRGQPLYMCWHLPPSRQFDWTTVRNSAGKFVPAPLVLSKREDGSLACGSFEGWDGYVTASQDVAWTIQTEPGSRGEALGEEQTDFRLTGTLVLDGRVGGLTFRSVPDEGEYVVELNPGSAQVRLVKHVLTVDARSGRKWFRQVVLQSGRLSFPIQRGAAHQVELIVNGPYIEVSVDGEVVIATLSAERDAGQVGAWVVEGNVELQDATLEILRRPEHS